MKNLDCITAITGLIMTGMVVIGVMLTTHLPNDLVRDRYALERIKVNKKQREIVFYVALIVSYSLD